MLPRKIRRTRSADELVVEQSTDPALPATLLEQAGINPGSLSRYTGVFLIGYSGSHPAGIAALQTQLDTAVMSCLLVLEPMRRRGLGAALVRAVRLAANTRGARTLYALGPDTAADYLARFGFTRVPSMPEAISGLAAHPAFEPERAAGFIVDISRDGLIER
jgi:N-acetylglutamate synthase-like GNAT family acetyltransferase